MTKYHTPSHDCKLPSVSGKLFSYARTRRWLESYHPAELMELEVELRVAYSPCCNFAGPDSDEHIASGTGTGRWPLDMR